jgi:hypothetical protein
MQLLAKVPPYYIGGGESPILSHSSAWGRSRPSSDGDVASDLDATSDGSVRPRKSAATHVRKQAVRRTSHRWRGTDVRRGPGECVRFCVRFPCKDRHTVPERRQPETHNLVL